MALVRLPNFETLTPDENSTIGSVLCNQSKEMGKSPVGATQDMLTESPWLAGSLPNVNGVILGGTFDKERDNKNKNQNYYQLRCV